MMENTMKNMDLMLEEMKNSLRKGNISSVKTLTDVYLTQFKKVRDTAFNKEDKSIVKACSNKLHAHRKGFENIIDSCDKRMTDSLVKGVYRDSHGLAIVLERVHKAIRDIEHYFPISKVDIEKEFPVEPYIQNLLNKSIETGTLVTFYDESHRSVGKTVSLIKKSYELDAVLITGTTKQAKLVRGLAENMGLSITVASAVREIVLVQIKRQLEDRGYLLDEPVDLKSLPNLKKYRLLGGFMRIII